MGKYSRLHMLSVCVFLTVFFTLSEVSAQGTAVIGEVRADGTVFIQSSDSRWLRVSATYPVLQETVIRTDEGSATVYFRDGSRVFLPKGAEASFGGSVDRYEVRLERGGVAFNVTSRASLAVACGAVSVSVNSTKIVRNVSYGRQESVRGAVSIGKTGVEVGSVSGLVAVSIDASDPRNLTSGEKMFIDPSGRYRVYMAQAVEGDKGQGNTDEEERKKDPKPLAALERGSTAERIAMGGISLSFIGGGVYVYDKGFRDTGFASPSSPGSFSGR
ncbi:MAG: hypothetical protein M0Z67_01060 [Nitrospiraceae bacterium]|nr:hypothetical protein [Nitrospiraceae bacterium]